MSPALFVMCHIGWFVMHLTTLYNYCEGSLRQRKAVRAIFMSVPSSREEIQVESLSNAYSQNLNSVDATLMAHL